MNNEPVAWMQTFTQEYKGVTETKHAVNIERIGINDIPLYTHPANLTDEEIDEVLFLSGYELVAQNEYDVTVRMPLSDWQEILKKASEK